jgi:hypothetical protein
MAKEIFTSAAAAYNSMGFSGCDIKATIRVPAYRLEKYITITDAATDPTKPRVKAVPQDLYTTDKVFNIGTLQTISVSTYNSKTPVKALGFKNPIAVARGGRTIAGTLIFNQMHLHVLDDNSIGRSSIRDSEGFLTYSSGDVDYIVNQFENPGQFELLEDKLKHQWDWSVDTTLLGEKTKPSDLPPFDIIILFANEFNADKKKDGRGGTLGKMIIYGVELVHDSMTMSIEDIYTEVQYQYIARDIEYFTSSDFGGRKSWSSSN